MIDSFFEHKYHLQTEKLCTFTQPVTRYLINTQKKNKWYGYIIKVTLCHVAELELPHFLCSC